MIIGIFYTEFFQQKLSSREMSKIQRFLTNNAGYIAVGRLCQFRKNGINLPMFCKKCVSAKYFVLVRFKMGDRPTIRFRKWSL